MKTVGIIGGLGPETTAKFYLELISSINEQVVDVRPRILIESISLPFKMEREVIVEGIGVERFVPYLVEAAQRLERVGADFLVMPCNSLHVFIREIRLAVAIPVLSIVEESAEFLLGVGASRVGLLATNITLRADLYGQVLERMGIENVVPSRVAQKEVSSIIHHLVMGIHTKRDRVKLLLIIEELKSKEVDVILLACTDLQILRPQVKGLIIVDTMKILAQATVKSILS